MNLGAGMVSLTFYGGIDEVGGNKIFIQDGDATVSLDFGMQMGKVNQIWSEFQQPRRLNGMGDLFEFDLLPRVPGIYRTDFTEHMDWKNDWKVPNSIDAVVLSHAHVDHCDYISYLRPSIPVYCGIESKLIMQGFDDMGTSEYTKSKESFKTYEKQAGGLSFTSASPKNRKVYQRDFNIIENHKKFKIGSMEFEPIKIDHSLPGTYGFLIHTSSGTIGYTADIRFHGARPDLSNDFVDTAAREGVDLLLCEGTRLKPSTSTSKANTEPEVAEQAAQRINECRDLVVCGYPPRDLDRFLSFYEAAKSTDRKLAIDLRQAYTLDLFANTAGCSDMYPSLDDDHLAIFVPRMKNGLVGHARDWPHELLLADYSTWARDLVGHSNATNYADMKDNHSSYITYMTDYTLKNLIDLRPQEGSTYIRSLTEPFNDEMELDHQKVKRWLAHFNLIPPGPDGQGVWDPLHVSGHGDAKQISTMVSRIAPKRLVPIHTENPELFGPIHDSVTRVSLGQTIEI